MLRYLQPKLFIFIILSLSLFSLETLAFSARAQWLSTSRIRVKMPVGSSNFSKLQFNLIDQAQPTFKNNLTNLPLISIEDGYATLDTSHISRKELEFLITQALKVVTSDSQQQILDSTAIQYSGLLDQAFFYEGSDLGANCSGNKCSLKLWAPTAQKVTAHFSDGQAVELVREQQGVWAAKLSTSYKNLFFQYEVQIFQPMTDKIENYYVTDPYSRSLSLNGTHTQLLDVSAKETQPEAWNTLAKPAFSQLKDAVIYELHMRDFSANDSSLEPAYRGTYLAFTKDSNGTRHLHDLAKAGLTHVHLLPFNDFGSVNEVKSEWSDTPVREGSDLEAPQKQVGEGRTTDSYNWGYDPVHFFSPEGSYAVDGNGASRIRETRSMIQSLNKMGLRVIQDVVFNHTYENGNDYYSIFDKIVPLYYYRVNDSGLTFKTSCCPDTASEHRMMEKLMVDSVVYWAKAFKLDGFRFDLMSFHSRSTILKIRDELRSLTLSKDGVDGSKILIYGEGWTFGSFYERYPDEAMTHENSFGSGIGFFNDRLRDAARGGTTNSNEKSDQGFATGLFFDFNKEPANRNTPVDLGGQYAKLLHLGDVIKVGLAGNLRDLSFKDHLGNTITGYSLKFRGQSVAFGAQASETINYVSAHDGYGIWDAIQAKAPFRTPGRGSSSLEERQRMQQLLMALPLLGQGIPFIESGSELLRSKNGDQDSYNSGDYFNRIDWTAEQNYWGVALPPAWKNISDWSFWNPRLTAPELKVTPELIRKTRDYFKALLQVRQSSKLFKLNTPAEISTKLKFIDNDTQAEAGLIAMHLQNKEEALLIFFNASLEDRSFNHDLLKRPWSLHPLLNEKIDSVLSDVVLNPSLGWIRIPGQSTVVLQLKNPETKKK